MAGIVVRWNFSTAFLQSDNRVIRLLLFGPEFLHGAPAASPFGPFFKDGIIERDGLVELVRETRS